MASNVQIANSALTKIGAARITALTDNVKAAREVNAIFELRRDYLLRTHNWSFAMTRASLPALSEAPAWGYTTLYQLPTDCLRVVQVNDMWVVPGLADYTSGPDSEPYKITGRRIETDIGAPLKLRYIKRVTDPAQFDAAFVEVFASDLADQVCEALTQSNTKREATRAVLRQSLLEAVRSNAIELPPEAIPDDSWILSRL
jgi:hypothetical protein